LSPSESDETQIEKLFADGDRALISSDAHEITRIYTEDYVQYDESGRPSDRAQLIEKLRSRTLRFISMKSTGRSIRLLRDDIALVHGTEEDVIERDGERVTVRYVYTDVVKKRDGRWQIVASQLAIPSS
jgi:uncharacterized protein (TIGR02246 family)